MGDHVDTPILNLGGNRVLVHVDVVFIDGVHDELVAFGLHPRGDEGCQIETWVAIQHELVVDDLKGGLLGHGALGDGEPRSRVPDIAGGECGMYGNIRFRECFGHHHFEYRFQTQNLGFWFEIDGEDENRGRYL